MIPDNVIGNLQGSILRCGNQLFKRSHELSNLGGALHTADAVITAGNNTQQLAVRGTIFGNSHGGMTGLFLQLQDICQGLIRLDVGIADNKASLVALDAGNHRSLRLNALRAIDEGHAALACQSDCHGVVGYRLHDSGNHRDIDGDRTLLNTLAILYNRGFQVYVRRNALTGRISRYQQVFAEGMGRFRKIICHMIRLPSQCSIRNFIVIKIHYTRCHIQSKSPNCRNFPENFHASWAIFCMHFVCGQLYVSHGNLG